MPGLTAAEHRTVQRETRALRNALARKRLRAHAEAESWCAALGADVQRDEYHGGLLWRVRIRAFQPAYARCLADAVADLDFKLVGWWRAGIRHGSTGAKLEPLWAARERWVRGEA